ncbi:MAG: hypothetical protein Q8O52_12860 [Sulfuritalea sp.]|nr:hypothetical protein [Sulfuritalea sp.]
MPDQVLRQVREACAERPPRSQVISSSRYVFDLDQRIIRIEDRDFVFIGPSPEAGRYSHALTVPIKAINPKAERAVFGIHKLPEIIDSSRALLDGNPLAGAQLSLTEADGLKQLILDLGPDHEVGMGSRFRIDLNYQMSLTTDGPLFVYTGAIQPSDYVAARKSFGLQEARKTVHLVVQRSTPFHGYVFDPKNGDCYPQPKDAESKRGVYLFEQRIEGPDSNWMRAKYFTVVVPK